MSRITRVQPQKHNRHRFNIFLDGKFAFATDEDTLVNFRLIEDKELTPEDLEEILLEAKIGKLMENMYRLFSVRQRSEKEVRDYFRIKNYGLRIKGKEQTPDLTIELVIKKLKQRNLLNDEEFAKAWVDARRRSRQKGKLALKQELFQKGINKEIIKEVINSADEEQLARQALVKKWEIWSPLPDLEKKKKAYAFLIRQGFEYEAVREVIENLLEKQ